MRLVNLALNAVMWMIIICSIAYMSLDYIDPGFWTDVVYDEAFDVR
jgi:hypothetical protein